MAFLAVNMCIDSIASMAVVWCAISLAEVILGQYHSEGLYHGNLLLYLQTHI